MRVKGRRNGLYPDGCADGVELFFDEKVGLSEDEVRGRVTPKADLVGCTPRQCRQELPNYLSQEVVDLMREDGWPGEDANRDIEKA